MTLPVRHDSAGNPSPYRRLTVLLDIPTPQRVPLLDRIAEATEVLVLYLGAGDEGRGWGALELGHPHLFLSQRKSSALVTCLRVLWSRRDSVFWCSGYDHPVKALSMVFARLLRTTLVMRSDSNVDREQRHSSRRRAVKKAFLLAVIGRSTRVWTIGHRNEEYWRVYGFHNCRLIPYTVPRPPQSAGVEPAETAALRATDACIFLYVGRLHLHQKGLADLLLAVQELPRGRRDWRLVLIGDGPGRSAAEDAARTDPRVLALGARNQDALAAWYKLADAVIVPSHNEPWGLVVNEARLAGKYVIASDAVGSAHDLLTDCEAGAVYPCGDVAALRQHLIAALATPRRSPGALIEVDAAKLVLQELRRG